jgi:hypothetical protein
MLHQQAEKILALLASGERITANHRFERTTNGISLFCAEVSRLFELPLF